MSFRQCEILLFPFSLKDQSQRKRLKSWPTNSINTWEQMMTFPNSWISISLSPIYLLNYIMMACLFLCRLRWNLHIKHRSKFLDLIKKCFQHLFLNYNTIILKWPLVQMHTSYGQVRTTNDQRVKDYLLRAVSLLRS